MEAEIWMPIKGWEGLYSISSSGRLMSFKKLDAGYILSINNKNGWYLTYVLQDKFRTETKRIHRLVAEHFIPNPDNKPQVNHIDMNKQNNHISNLEWSTSSENVRHAIIGKPEMLEGINRWNKELRPIPVMQLSKSGDFIAQFPNCIEASIATGVCSRNIHQVAKQTEYRPGLKRSQAGGFVWKFNYDAK